jgi:hypothetical protein
MEGGSEVLPAARLQSKILARVDSLILAYAEYDGVNIVQHLGAELLEPEKHPIAGETVETGDKEYGGLARRFDKDSVTKSCLNDGFCQLTHLLPGF